MLTHENHVIVLGGAINDDNIHDDIEVLNLTQPLQWTKSNIKLPGPCGTFPSPHHMTNSTL